MWGFFLILGLAVLLIVALIYIGIRYKFDYWRLLSIPHEEPKKTLEVFREMWHSQPAVCVEPIEVDVDRIGQLYRRFKGSGPFCGFYHVLQPTVLVLDLELCQQILIKDFGSFNDRGHYYNKSSDPLSAHLFNLSDQNWRETRPRLECTFTAEALSSLLEGLQRQCHNLVNHFEDSLEGNNAASAVKVLPLMSRYVCATMATCVFGLPASGGDAEQKLEEFHKMTLEAHKTPHRHGRYVQDFLYRHPALGKKLGLALTAQNVQTYFMGLVQDVVSQRELNRLVVNDYMQLLIDMKRQEFRNAQSSDEANAEEQPLQKRLLNELAGHAYGFLRTGFEATSLAISWALQELALQQEVQQNVREEINAALQRHEDRLDYECLAELQLLWQVVQETIRLHPLTPYLTRRTLYDYRVPNHTKYLLKRDMCVVIPVHAIHNDPEYFPEPQLFRPERFSEEATRSRDQCVWLGFGAGPRNCIALQFAQLQMRLTLASLLRSYKFSVDPESPMPTLEGGVPLMVQRI